MLLLYINGENENSIGFLYSDEYKTLNTEKGDLGYADL